MIKVFKIVIQVAVLYFFAIIGNLLSLLLHLPISGSIIGMFIVFALLYFKILPISKIEMGASFLLAEMLLFFVPSAVGILQYKEAIFNYGTQFLLVICLSTITVMIVTGIVAERFSRQKERYR
ncbi:CidA/LrgA family protein [Terrilactibacillus tamarindi]|uniref:CidA/LrgA family protein n=1 Tax=Terrilactibacillus tamarindi TaxID=2599694 RepID=UPI0012BD03A2|nr:CidA/LrgA family holin-like protein [Terrilactibacillus tamarindi]